MGAEYKEDCVFCPDHARQLREAEAGADVKEQGTSDCVDKTGFVFNEFHMNRRGGMTVDREALHRSAGYKRQVAALQELAAMRDRESI